MRGFSSVAKAMAAAVCLAGAVGSANAGRQELGYAIEDAAFQTAMKLATDERVDVKRIAFVKLMVGVTDISEASLLGTIFENGLSAVPSDFTFITHQDRDAEWTEIDGFFKAAEDFQDYDPATLPKTGVFAMADSFLVGRLVGATDTEKKSTVQVSLRLIRISTAERIWAGTVEGVYDDPGPGLEMVDSNTRLAIERAVATCAAEVSPKLAGYQALVLPFAASPRRSPSRFSTCPAAAPRIGCSRASCASAWGRTANSAIRCSRRSTTGSAATPDRRRTKSR